MSTQPTQNLVDSTSKDGLTPEEVWDMANKCGCTEPLTTNYQTHIISWMHLNKAGMLDFKQIWPRHITKLSIQITERDRRFQVKLFEYIRNELVNLEELELGLMSKCGKPTKVSYECALLLRTLKQIRTRHYTMTNVGNGQCILKSIRSGSQLEIPIHCIRIVPLHYPAERGEWNLPVLYAKTIPTLSELLTVFNMKRLRIPQRFLNSWMLPLTDLIRANPQLEFLQLEFSRKTSPHLLYNHLLPVLEAQPNLQINPQYSCISYFHCSRFAEPYSVWNHFREFYIQDVDTRDRKECQALLKIIEDAQIQIVTPLNSFPKHFIPLLNAIQTARIHLLVLPTAFHSQFTNWERLERIVVAPSELEAWKQVWPKTSTLRTLVIEYHLAHEVVQDLSFLALLPSLTRLHCFTQLKLTESSGKALQTHSNLNTFFIKRPVNIVQILRLLPPQLTALTICDVNTMADVALILEEISHLKLQALSIQGDYCCGVLGSLSHFPDLQHLHLSSHKTFPTELAEMRPALLAYLKHNTTLQTMHGSFPPALLDVVEEAMEVNTTLQYSEQHSNRINAYKFAYNRNRHQSLEEISKGNPAFFAFRKYDMRSTRLTTSQASLESRLGCRVNLSRPPPFVIRFNISTMNTFECKRLCQHCLRNRSGEEVIQLAIKKVVGVGSNPTYAFGKKTILISRYLKNTPS